MCIKGFLEQVCILKKLKYSLEEQKKCITSKKEWKKENYKSKSFQQKAKVEQQK